MAKPIFTALDNMSLQDIEAEGDLIPLLTTEDEEALEKEDLPVVMGAVLVIASIFVIVNILVDIIYAWLDPRVRAH